MTDKPLPWDVPATTKKDATPAYHGISVRDYFAARAMQGLLARGLHYETEGRRGIHRGLEECDIAGHAYSMADAMLEARSK